MSYSSKRIILKGMINKTYITKGYSKGVIYQVIDWCFSKLQNSYKLSCLIKNWAVSKIQNKTKFGNLK